MKERRLPSVGGRDTPAVSGALSLPRLATPATPRTGTWVGIDMLYLFAVLGLALAARLYRIGAQSFWLDEVFTWQRIHLTPAAMVADSFANRHFPVYFLLLRWIATFHPGDFTWLRVPSAVFGAAAVGVVFVIARRLGGRSAGLIAAMLMALSPLQMQYGQEARPYALVVLLISIALWGLVQLAQQPLQASPAGRQAGMNRFGWVTYVIASALALSVLGDTAPWLLASNAALFLIWRDLRPDAGAARTFRRHWMLGQAIILLCCTPFYVAVLAAADRHALQSFNWIPSLTWHHLWVVVSTTYLMHGAAVVRFGLLPMAVKMLAPLLALLAGVGFYRLRGRAEGSVLLLAFAVLPLLVLLVSLVKPLLVPRYILWSSVPFFVAAGVGGAALGRRAITATVSLLLVLCVINIAPLYRIEIKPRWNAAAAMLSVQVRPGDTVFTDDANGPLMLRILQPADAKPMEDRALVTNRLSVAIVRWRAGSRIWVVSGRAAMGEREDLAAFKRRLAKLGMPQREIPEGSEVTVLLFAPPTAGAHDSDSVRVVPR